MGTTVSAIPSASKKQNKKRGLTKPPNCDIMLVQPRGKEMKLMDWELIFWIAAPIVLLGGGIIAECLKERRDWNRKQWEWEHQDDWNKD